MSMPLGTGDEVETKLSSKRGLELAGGFYREAAAQGERSVGEVHQDRLPAAGLPGKNDAPEGAEKTRLGPDFSSSKPPENPAI